MYKYVDHKLGFKHNLCIFHLMKSFSKIFDNEIKKLKFDTVKDIRKYFDYGTLIKSLFYSKNYQKAGKIVKYLRNEKINMPESFQDF